MPSLSKLLQNTEPEEKTFGVERISHQDADGQIFTSSYEGGVLLTTDKFQNGNSVVTVKDDKGKKHVLGENFR